MKLTEAERKKLETLKEKKRLVKKEQAKEQRKFKDMCKQKLGYTPTELADIIKQNQSFVRNNADLRIKVTLACDVIRHFELRDINDVKKWINVMLNDDAKEYWMRRRNE